MVCKHPNQQSVDWYHRADDPRKSKTKHLFSNFIRFQNQMSFIYVPSRHYLSIMRTKIPEWSKSNVEVFDSGARSCIQYAIHKKNLYTYVWMTAVNKWQCFHFSWVKVCFVTTAIYGLRIIFRTSRELMADVTMTDKQTVFEPWSHLSSLNIWRLWGSPTKPTLDESFLHLSWIFRLKIIDLCLLSE